MRTLTNFIKRFTNGLLSRFGFQLVNIRNYGVFDKSKYYAIEKGKYLLTRRSDREYDQMGDFENNIETFDKLWGEQEHLDRYMEEARRLFLDEVATYAAELSRGKGSVKVVDIGTGPGELLRLLKDKLKLQSTSYELYGTDYSPAGIKICEEIMPEGHFKVEDIHDTSYNDNTFDLTFCMEVIEHIEFPLNAIDQLVRITKPGGYVIITIPNGDLDQWTGHLNFWSMQSFSSFISKYTIQDSKYIERGTAMMFVIKK